MQAPVKKTPTGWPKQTATMKIRSGQKAQVQYMLKRLGL